MFRGTRHRITTILHYRYFVYESARRRLLWHRRCALKIIRRAPVWARCISCICTISKYIYLFAVILFSTHIPQERWANRSFRCSRYTRKRRVWAWNLANGPGASIACRVTSSRVTRRKIRRQRPDKIAWNCASANGNSLAGKSDYCYYSTQL